MKIAVDISPISKQSQSAHKIRGVGKYITLLRDNLERFDNKNTYIFTDDPKSITQDVDLVYYPYFDPFFISLPFRKKSKTVVMVHDIIPLKYKKNFPVGAKGIIKWSINKFLLRRVDAIVTNSNASFKDITSLVDIDKSKVFPVYLSVDEVFKDSNVAQDEISSLRGKYSLPEKFVLYVGDVTWNKNLPRVIKAIKRAGIPLVMIGKVFLENNFDSSNPWNRDRMELKNETEGNPLFIKPGFVPTEDLSVIYNLASALLMPSLDEGFGLPVLEAMNCGCPVITSKRGSLPEVAGDAALYVDPESIDEIFDSIIKIIQNNDMRKNLIRRGIRQAEKFTLKKMIEGTVSVYEKVYSNEKKS